MLFFIVETRTHNKFWGWGPFWGTRGPPPNGQNFKNFVFGRRYFSAVALIRSLIALVYLGPHIEDMAQNGPKFENRTLPTVFELGFFKSQNISTLPSPKTYLTKILI